METHGPAEAEHTHVFIRHVFTHHVFIRHVFTPYVFIRHVFTPHVFMALLCTELLTCVPPESSLWSGRQTWGL